MWSISPCKQTPQTIQKFMSEEWPIWPLYQDVEELSLSKYQYNCLAAILVVLFSQLLEDKFIVLMSDPNICTFTAKAWDDMFIKCRAIRYK